jgi:hypothetical protein
LSKARPRQQQERRSRRESPKMPGKHNGWKQTAARGWPNITSTPPTLCGVNALQNLTGT